MSGYIKMNILLLMPKLVKTVGEGYQFPLGIAYISSALKKAGNNVFTINLNHNNESLSGQLQKSINENRIDIVATGGISIQYNSLYEIFRETKHVNANIITIAGGGIISAEPEIAMQALQYVDIGVIGEGEVTICELINALKNKTDLRSVNGLIIKDEKSYIITNIRDEIQDLDSLPYPDYEGFELEKYLELPPPDVNNLNEKRLVFFLGSRSCPYHCTFCFHTVGKKYRLRSIKSIKEEIDYLIKRYNVGFLFMADELFGLDKKRLQEFCIFMKEKGLLWRGSFRVNDIDSETIEMLINGNCAVIGLGLESADNSILEGMRKKITIEETEKALKIIHDANMPFSGNFIFGDINETVATAKRTLDWWEAHPEYNINLWPIITYPGTQLYKYACEKGIISDRIQFLKEGCPAVNVSKLNDQEMSWLAKELMERPHKKAKSIENIKVTSINKQNGRITITGNCARCAHENEWKDIRLFISVNLACKKCAQKHNIPFPYELQEKLAGKIEILLQKYPRIGLWGVTYHTISLYEKFDILQSEAVYAIDNANLKQRIDLYGKKVLPPQVLAEENIPYVISFYPNSTQQIAEQIEMMYPNVKHVVDAYTLIAQ